MTLHPVTRARSGDRAGGDWLDKTSCASRVCREEESVQYATAAVYLVSSNVRHDTTSTLSDDSRSHNKAALA